MFYGEVGDPPLRLTIGRFALYQRYRTVVLEIGDEEGGCSV